MFLIAAAECFGFSSGVLVVSGGSKISLHSFDIGLKWLAPYRTSQLFWEFPVWMIIGVWELKTKTQLSQKYCVIDYKNFIKIMEYKENNIICSFD